MKSREILAANLKRLRKENPRLDRYQDITAASGVSNGTLDRISRAAAATSVDVLDQLAGAFGVEPHELINPAMKVRKPAGVPMASAVAMELALLYDDVVRDLGPIDRARVYQAAQEAITRELAPAGVRPTGKLDQPVPSRKRPV